MGLLNYRPDCAQAMYLLGTVFRVEGELWLSIHYLEKATQLDPSLFEGRMALANVFREAKLTDRAITIYSQINASFPSNIESIVNLGTAYLEKGLYDISIDYYQAAIALDGNSSEYYGYLGNALKEKGMIEDSERCYEHSLKINPGHIDSLNNLANIKREKGNLNIAINLYKQALKICPTMAVALSNLGCVYQQMGKYSESFSFYNEALRISPNFVDALMNLGCLYKELQDLNNSLICFNRILQINPNIAEAHNNIGTVFRDNSKFIDAIPHFKKALKLKPNFPDAFCNLSHSCLVVCDWSKYDERVKQVVAIVKEQIGRNRPPPVHPHHTMLYAPLSGELAIKIAEKYANACVDKARQLNRTYSYEMPAKGERIKVGYVSYDFCNHPTSHLMQSIPGLHDIKDFDVHCYALNPSDGSKFRSKITGEVEHFVDLSTLPDSGHAADKINNDGIHVLVNINGYTKGARNEIFAMRPSPVQIMWLGYPNTSGSSFMDYIVLDSVTAPSRLSHLYSEKLAHMPSSFFIGDHLQMFGHLKNRYCLVRDRMAENDKIINFPDNCKFVKIKEKVQSGIYRSDMNHVTLGCEIPNIIDLAENGELYLPQVDTKLIYGSAMQKLYPTCASGEESISYPVYTCRKMYNLPQNAVVYCNFNQFYKYDPDTFDLWCRILQQVPNSVLWLLMFPPGGHVNLLEVVRGKKIDEKRIVFSSVAPKEEHVRRGQLADVCLDTHLCNGHTTGVDILFGGTPMVTLPGEHLASRVAASQLKAIGCGELVAKTGEEYVDIATRLGIDPSFLERVKKKVSENRFNASIFNVEGYVRDLEGLYKRMVNQYISCGRPDHLLAKDD